MTVAVPRRAEGVHFSGHLAGDHRMSQVITSTPPESPPRSGSIDRDTGRSSTVVGRTRQVVGSSPTRPTSEAICVCRSGNVGVQVDSLCWPPHHEDQLCSGVSQRVAAPTCLHRRLRAKSAQPLCRSPLTGSPRRRRLSAQRQHWSPSPPEWPTRGRRLELPQRSPAAQLSHTVVGEWAGPRCCDDRALYPSPNPGFKVGRR
jgi:hypothetical protein